MSGLCGEDASGARGGEEEGLDGIAGGVWFGVKYREVGGRVLNAHPGYVALLTVNLPTNPIRVVRIKKQTNHTITKLSETPVHCPFSEYPELLLLLGVANRFSIPNVVETDGFQHRLDNITRR